MLPALDYFINFCIKPYNHKRLRTQFIGRKTAISGSLVTASTLTPAREPGLVKSRTRLTLEKRNEILSQTLFPIKQRSWANGRLRKPRRGRAAGPAPYLVEVQLPGLGVALHRGGSQLLQQAAELRRRQAQVRAEHTQHILAEGERGPRRLPSEAGGRQEQEPSHRPARGHPGRGCPSRA